MVLGVSITAQTLLFLKSLLLGACLMLLYDCFRILRIAVPNPPAVILWEDIVYCAVCAVATFLFAVSANWGEVRFFILLGEALGATLCALTVSRVVMACSRAIIALIHGILRLIWQVFLRPIFLLIRLLARWMVKITNFCGIRAKKSLNRANYGLKRRRVMLYNLIMSGRKKKAAARAEKRKCKKRRRSGKKGEKANEEPKT